MTILEQHFPSFLCRLSVDKMHLLANVAPSRPFTRVSIFPGVLLSHKGSNSAMIPYIDSSRKILREIASSAPRPDDRFCVRQRQRTHTNSVWIMWNTCERPRFIFPYSSYFIYLSYGIASIRFYWFVLDRS